MKGPPAFRPVANDASGSLLAARVRVKRSSADGRLKRPVSSERGECGLVGCTVVDDFQGRLGQPERLRHQSSIRGVHHPNLQLKCQIVERSEDSAICRLSNCPKLHCTALGSRFVRWNADFGEDRFQGLAESLNEGSTIRAGTTTGNKLRSLTASTTWIRPMRIRLAYQSPRTVSGGADSGSGFELSRSRSFWVQRRTNTVQRQRAKWQVSVHQCFLSAVERSYLS